MKMLIIIFLSLGDCKAHGVALKAIFYGYWKSLTPLQEGRLGKQEM
jgi:hypothetical protein